MRQGYKFQYQFGFTYVGLLIIVAILGLTLMLASTLWSFSQQREKERQLLFVGNQFRYAIAQYYERSPGNIKAYPVKLEDLLQDNRFVSIKRHLRKIYRDPITNTTNWGIVSAPEGGIMGVFSLSKSRPIKQDNFLQINSDFQGAKEYSEWKFVYTRSALAN